MAAASKALLEKTCVSGEDWAASRRVAFCVGDDDAATTAAWEWVDAHFLEPNDEVVLLRVWVPDSAAFAGDVDPDFAAEVDFHDQTKRTELWLPSAVRDGIRRRESMLYGSHEVVLLRKPLAASGEGGDAAGEGQGRWSIVTPAEQIVHYCRRHGVDIIVLGTRPHHGTIARTILGSVSDAVLTTSPTPCLVLRRGGSVDVAGIEVAAGPGAVAEAGATQNDEHADVRGVTQQMQAMDIAAAVALSRGTATRGAAVKAAEKDEVDCARVSHAPPSTSAPPHPTGRRVAIAVDGSPSSWRMVHWCCRNLVRPTDEILLVHAVDLSEDEFRSMYTEPASPPLGGPASRATTNVETAWRNLDPLLSLNSAPYPSLGGGKKPVVGDEKPPPPGYLFAGGRNRKLVDELTDTPWQILDDCLLAVAEHQNVYRCAFPPKGLLVLTPARLSLCWLVKNQKQDLLVVGSRGLTGLSRAVLTSTRFVDTPPPHRFPPSSLNSLGFCEMFPYLTDVSSSDAATFLLS